MGMHTHSSLFWVDSSTQQRGLPAVHLLLRVTGQLQMPVVLIHVPMTTPTPTNTVSWATGLYTCTQSSKSETPAHTHTYMHAYFSLSVHLPIMPLLPLHICQCSSLHLFFSPSLTFFLSFFLPRNLHFSFTFPLSILLSLSLLLPPLSFSPLSR